MYNENNRLTECMRSVGRLVKTKSAAPAAPYGATRTGLYTATAAVDVYQYSSDQNDLSTTDSTVEVGRQAYTGPFKRIYLRFGSIALPENAAVHSAVLQLPRVTYANEPTLKMYELETAVSPYGIPAHKPEVLYEAEPAATVALDVTEQIKRRLRGESDVGVVIKSDEQDWLDPTYIAFDVTGIFVTVTYETRELQKAASDRYSTTVRLNESTALALDLRSTGHRLTYDIGRNGDGIQLAYDSENPENIGYGTGVTVTDARLVGENDTFAFNAHGHTETLTPVYWYTENGLKRYVSLTDCDTTAGDADNDEEYVLEDGKYRITVDGRQYPVTTEYRSKNAVLAYDRKRMDVLEKIGGEATKTYYYYIAGQKRYVELKTREDGTEYFNYKCVRIGNDDVDLSSTMRDCEGNRVYLSDLYVSEQEFYVKQQYSDCSILTEIEKTVTTSPVNNERSFQLTVFNFNMKRLSGTHPVDAFDIKLLKDVNKSTETVRLYESETYDSISYQYADTGVSEQLLAKENTLIQLYDVLEQVKTEYDEAQYSTTAKEMESTIAKECQKQYRWHLNTTRQSDADLYCRQKKEFEDKINSKPEGDTGQEGDQVPEDTTDYATMLLTVTRNQKHNVKNDILTELQLAASMTADRNALDQKAYLVETYDKLLTKLRRNIAECRADLYALRAAERAKAINFVQYGGVTYGFDFDGRLANLDGYDITYTDEPTPRIDCITADGAEAYRFFYAGNTLAKVRHAHGEDVFTYAGDRLTDAPDLHITYEGTRIAGVSDPAEIYLRLSATDDTQTVTRECKIASISAAGVTPGQSICESLRVTLRPRCTDVETDERVTRYQFAKDGRLKSRCVLAKGLAPQFLSAELYDSTDRTEETIALGGTARGYLVNVDFSAGLTGWSPYTDGGYDTTMTEILDTDGNRCLRLRGNVLRSRYVEQFVRADVLQGKTDLVLSAFAKADSKPTADTSAEFRLTATVLYADGTDETFTADFDSNTSDWQLAAVSVTVDPNRTPTEVRVRAEYAYNTGDCLFDNIRLTPFDGTRTAYTEQFDLASETGPSGKTSYAYDGGTVAAITASADKTVTTVCRYDGEGRILRAEDTDGFVTEYSYDEDGKATATRYHKDAPHDRYVSADAPADKVSAAYDAQGNCVSVAQEADGETVANRLTYTRGLLTSVAARDGARIDYAYDGKGRRIAVDVGGERLATVTYDGKTTACAYGNGSTVLTETRADDRPTKVTLTENGATKQVAAYTYDQFGAVTSVQDGLTGRTHAYTYDAAGNCTAHTVSDKTTVFGSASVIEKDKVAVYAYDVAEGDKHHFEYHYAYADGRLTETAAPDGSVTAHTYDKLGRPIERADRVDGKAFAGERYAYATVAGSATDLVTRVQYMQNGKTINTLQYAYDEGENITSIKDNGRLTNRYTYDALDRLIREDNARLGKTYTVTYDRGGNILARNEYAYTTGDLTDRDTVAEFDYAYDARFGDRLTAVNGDEIGDYDALGNPHSYLGNTLTWKNVRQLASFNELTFDYDADGIRTRKGDTAYMTLDGRLIREKSPTHTIDYVYDEIGVCAIRVNDSDWYRFRRNLQGDVTHILDSAGDVVVEYVYDAWGNHDVYDGAGNRIATDLEHIGNLNPIRYRGYYYDAETDLYYLQTRYYDPATCRFVNADDVTYADAETLQGLNLYAYCGNNPVMRIDPTGHKWSWKKFWNFIGAVGTALAVVGLTVATAGIAAAALGASAAVIGATMTGALVGGLVAGAVEIGSQLITNGYGNIDIGAVAMETFTGAAYGAISGAMGSTTSPVLRLAMRGSLVGLGAINTAYYSIKEGKSFGAVMADIGISIVTGLAIQGAMIGVDAYKGRLSKELRELRLLDSKLFTKTNMAIIVGVTAGKLFWKRLNTILRKYIG